MSFKLMSCPNCNRDDPQNREMCPDCGYPVKPIPVPPGGKIKFNGYDWFVLDKQGDRMLIITEKVIEKRAYHHEEASVTWETCDLRKYLYNSFNEADRARIIEVVNENSDNPWYGTSGGNPTTDKVFLLSIAEVVKYFGDSGQLSNRPHNPGFDWLKDEFLFLLGDQYNINRRAVDENNVVVHWWLRSPGARNRYAAKVYGKEEHDEFDHGDISIGGEGCAFINGHMIFDEGCGELTRKQGVRPALWLNNIYEEFVM